MKELIKLENALNAYEALSLKLRKYGACDTEPECVYAEVLERALRGEPPDIPQDGKSWQLYSVSMKCDSAARRLAAATQKVVDALNKVPMGKRQEAIQLVKNHSRVSDAYIS